MDLIRIEKLTVAEAARRLGVGAATLRKWVKLHRHAPATAAPPSGEQELRRLREENRQLKMERDGLECGRLIGATAS